MGGARPRREQAIAHFARRYGKSFKKAERPVPPPDALFVLSAGIDQLVQARLRDGKDVTHLEDTLVGCALRLAGEGGTMDLTFNDAEPAFRDELRAWFADNAPGRPAERAEDEERYALRRDWQRKLADGGWAGVHWPVEYGGRGATLTQSAIFFEELGRSGAPLPANVLGLLLGGPTIMIWGTDEQKERYLNPILTAEEIWCQGFSEPEAGSRPGRAQDARGQGRRRLGRQRPEGLDLRRQYSKWCMLVARTDTEVAEAQGPDLLPDGHGADPGVEVRPLRQITGEPEFNELFLERRAHPRRQRPGRRGQRLEGRADHADERARRPGVLPAGAAAPDPRRAVRGGRPPRAAGRPGRSPTSSASCT